MEAAREHCARGASVWRWPSHEDGGEPDMVLAAAGDIHVRGFKEEGTTTTTFDMTVRNGISRVHLCIEALRRAPRMADRAAPLIEACASMLARHDTYIREHLEDMPEVRDWTWTEA